MNDALYSWSPAASRLLDGEQRAKVASVRARVLREAANGKPFCTTCGVECPNHEELSTHVAAHQQAGWAAVCAICGLRSEDCRKRTTHEQKAHNFQRYAFDSFKNDAVSISKMQLVLVENVGFLFGAVQATAARSAHPRRTEQFAPATFAEIMRKMEQTTGHKSAFTCSCRCKLPSVNARIQHEKLHEKGVRFQCSACAQIYPNAAVRNAHEARVHAVERPPETRHWKEAVKIPRNLYSELLGVGVNFAVMQQQAVSPPPNSSVRLLESSEWEASNRPITTWATSTSAPPSQPVALIDRIWARFIAAPPAVLFFDHQEFAPSCGELPLFRWAADPRCKLLLLRSASVEWRQEPRALENFVFLRLPLAASFVLCFCKVSGAQLAARLVAPAANCRSFGELMEVVAASGESAIVVARPEERSSIRHLDTGDFVVL